MIKLKIFADSMKYTDKIMILFQKNKLVNYDRGTMIVDHIPSSRIPVLNC